MCREGFILLGFKQHAWGRDDVLVQLRWHITLWKALVGTRAKRLQVHINLGDDCRCAWSIQPKYLMAYQ